MMQLFGTGDSIDASAFIQMILAALFGSGVVAAWMSRRKTAAETDKAHAEASAQEAEAASQWISIAQQAWVRAVDLEKELSVLRSENRHRWRLVATTLKQCADTIPARKEEIEAMIRSLDNEEMREQRKAVE